jgi:hypothetical protein
VTEEFPAPPGRPAPTLEYAPRKRAAWKLTRLEIGVAVAVTLALLLTLLPSLGRRRRHDDPRLRCASNLRQVAQAVQLYANENRGRFPPDVATLLLTQDLSADNFVCRFTNDTAAYGPTPEATAAQLTAAAGHLSYVYCGAGMTGNVPPSTVIAYEPPSNHGDGLWVAYADTKVEWLDSRRGRKLLADLAAGHNPPGRRGGRHTGRHRLFWSPLPPGGEG